MGKIATLFKAGELHLPEKKIIKAEDYSLLVDTLSMIPTLEKDTKEYKKHVVQETEIAKDKAMQEGFDEGMKIWADQLAYFEKESLEMKKNFEDKIVPIAVAIAKKIVGYEIESAEGSSQIIKNALKAVTLHKRITVYVSAEDIEELESRKSSFRSMFEELKAFSFQERDDIEKGGCIIETEAGIIDARLPTLWEAIEKSFAKILSQKAAEDEGELQS